MSLWTETIDGLCDHVTLLQELGERSVALDPEIVQALVKPARAVRCAAPPSPVAASSQPPPAADSPHPSATVTAASRGNATPEARRAALSELAERIEACAACPLRRSRNRSVPGQGNANAPDVLFIGEAPGADEDRQGVAFIGAAGQLLTRMIAAMGYTRDEVFISNICKCHPPNNRTPTPLECTTCLPFLRAQINIIQPKTIVLLGGTAIKALLDTQVGVTRMQGQWTRYENIPVMPTYHPSYLLRFEPAKRDAWQALKRVLALLGKPVPGKQRETATS